MNAESISQSIGQNVRRLVFLTASLIAFMGLSISTYQVSEGIQEINTLIIEQTESVIIQLAADGRYLELPGSIGRIIGKAPDGVDFEIKVVGQPGDHVLVNEKRISDPTLWVTSHRSKQLQRSVPGYGYITVTIAYSTLGAILRTGCTILLILAVFMAGLWLFLKNQIGKLNRSFVSIQQLEEQLLSSEDSKDLPTFPTDPLNRLAGIVENLIQNKANEAYSKALVEQATQVAHDIRSPLAALGSIEQDLGALPEVNRLMLRSAINRIRDIANNLLNQNQAVTQQKETLTWADPKQELVATLLLPSLVEPLITEMRMQFRTRIGIVIDGRMDANVYGLFAKVQSTEFKRVISNLVNNAVEVLGDYGLVDITLTSRGQWIELTVRDNGKGIQPEILAKLGQKGETHGKEGGSGLGLYHAKSSVESWGGTLKIESQVGRGTSVIIRLPQAPSADWFVSELKLIPQSALVILDDDASIHQIWHGRTDSIRVKESKIDVIHLSSPGQFRSWIRDNPSSAERALYLCDYELLGYKETGLSLIEELKLGEQSILVTSRFEEARIVEGCRRLGVKLIPKGMAGYVPIGIAKPQEYFDAILIDDDELVHLTWKSSAKNKSKSLKGFVEPDAFFSVCDLFNKNSPVYVDVSLFEGVRGEDVAKKISDLGFKNVFLSTGYEPEEFSNLIYIKGVVGKDPPF